MNVFSSFDQTMQEKVLQFGEGNFLRGFVDWMLQKMNEKGLFQGKAVMIQPLAVGLIEQLNQQNGTYTLLMRVVTGYPKDEIGKLTERLGYKDNLLNSSELFHLWVIEGDKNLARELLFTKTGLNVLPHEELAAYADAVLERFANPFIKHYLLSISLNSVSKFKARVLSSITEYAAIKRAIPPLLTVSLAALIVFYKGDTLLEGKLIGRRGDDTYQIQDDLPSLQWFQKAWAQYDGTVQAMNRLAGDVLGNTAFWGEDLNRVQGLQEQVALTLSLILQKGIKVRLRKCSFAGKGGKQA